jgi:menaquinol-cytochrome c reductase iron-sulfur subunit
MADEATLSRRSFLNTAVNAMGAVITGIIAVPVAGMFLDPVLKQAAGAADWVKLTTVASVTDTPTVYLVTAEKADGFMKKEVRANVYAFLDKNEKGETVPVAMSNTCTHLGCPASWVPDEQKFKCPCHGGVYDKTGKNIAGPPPKPLPRYATKVEGGDVYIQVT